MYLYSELVSEVIRLLSEEREERREEFRTGSARTRLYFIVRNMEKENTAVYKSKKFAIRIVKLYKHLSENKNEYILSKQLLRSGTSIGANLAESECAMSKKDFLSKIYIAFKETNETLYWLELLFETEFLTKSEYDSVKSDCEEIKRMLSASTKTLIFGI